MGSNDSKSLRAALHLHSHFSLLRGTDSIDALLAWAGGRGGPRGPSGYSAVALAEVNSMYGAVPFYQAARAAGIKPLLGVELFVENEPRVETRGSAGAAERDRLTLIARSREGYRNLCRLTTRLQLSPREFDLLGDVAANCEGLFVLCDRADWLAPLAARLPAGRLFAELTPGEGSQARQELRRIYAAAGDARVPVVAALDSYFGDSQLPYQLHRIVTDIRLNGSNRRPAQRRELDYQSPDRRLWSAAEMGDFFARCPQAIANANSLAEQCADDVLELGQLHLPISQTPPGQTSFAHLYRLCAAGLRRRYRPIRPEAVSRLAYELSVIDKLHFADYFLFVHEIVAFARRRGIPVDVRGSAASSLVAYVLGFTQVCPLEADLYFERFLHEGRTDCPDVDIDLCWRRRDEVIDFCYRRWGHDRVAMICTHNTMRARGAFVEVGKVLGLTAGQAFALSRHIPEGIAAYLQRDWRELAEARRNLPLDDPHFRRILALAGRLEGAPRHLGIHCGGLVIAPGPLTDYLPLQRAAKGIVVTQYEMNAVEAVGLVKMDLLGNRALSEVAEAGREIANRKLQIENCKSEETFSRRTEGPHGSCAVFNSQFEIRNLQFPDHIDPDDPETGKLLSAGDTMGVFQAESPGMRNLCRQLRVGNREELTVALSVIRPGPAAVGMKASYVARHLGREQAGYLHPKLRTLLARTHGVMVYQEDTMRVAVGIAGFSPAEADMLRKAVSKKRSPQRMAELRGRFLAKAAAFTADLSPQAAGELWEHIAHFAGYSFCRAHACVYGRIAWQTAWLKTHHPAAFYAAVFNNHMGMFPLRVHVADAMRHGLRVLGPDVNFSEVDATLVVNPLPKGEGECAIRLGLGNRFVRALSQGCVERIIRHRPFRSLAHFRLAARPSEPELVNLVRCGACDGLGPNRRAMLAEATLEEPAGELLTCQEGLVGIGHWALGKEKSTVGRSSDAQCPMPNAHSTFDIRHSPFPWAREFTLAEKLQAEIDVLGLFLSVHPMELLEGDWTTSDRLPGLVGKRVAVAGILDATRTTATRAGRLMRFVTLEDATGLVECTFFPEAYQRFGHLFYHLGPFRVEGVVEDDRGALTLSADRAESLVEQSPLKLPAELYPPSQIV